MEFDVRGIYTVATEVLPNGAAYLRAAQQLIANAHLAGDPFLENIPSSDFHGERMFAATDKVWNEACVKLQEAMTATVAGIDYTCQVLIETANTYDQTELANTDAINQIGRLLDG